MISFLKGVVLACFLGMVLVGQAQDPSPQQVQLEVPGKIIHRGVLSPDGKQFFITVSNPDFTQFDVLMVEGSPISPSTPQPAFFNSQWDDHGMSFSPDGKTLVFSSTRPVGIPGVLEDTWHLWQSNLKNKQWTEPQHIDIPNLRDRLTSHPSLDRNNNLYFHASDSDYSFMDIHVARWQDGAYQPATVLSFEFDQGTCTPYISTDGEDLYFAAIGLDLTLYVVDPNEQESHPSVHGLPAIVNQNGQGNPVLSPNGDYLFYTRMVDGKWCLFCVATADLH